MLAPVVVVDFDGTLALEDVGDALCERFAEPGWEAIGAAWSRGEMGLAEAQRRMWASVRASEADLRAAADEVGRLRPGADALFARAAAGSIQLVLASGGFGLYIEHLLGPRRLSTLSAAYYNELAPGPNGARPHFPHTDLADGLYALCKARVLERHHRPGHRLVFCGDGSSDRSVLRVAKPLGVELFTVAGSLLATHCNERRVAHVSFDDFATVLRAIES